MPIQQIQILSLLLSLVLGTHLRIPRRPPLECQNLCHINCKKDFGFVTDCLQTSWSCLSGCAVACEHSETEENNTYEHCRSTCDTNFQLRCDKSGCVAGCRRGSTHKYQFEDEDAGPTEDEAPIAIATASQSKFYQACQFKILSSTQQEVVTACADKTAVHYEYVACSSPILTQASEQIIKKCCQHCLQCSGCEDARTVSVDQYEQDSPGEVAVVFGPANRPRTSLRKKISAREKWGNVRHSILDKIV